MNSSSSAVVGAIPKPVTQCVPQGLLDPGLGVDDRAVEVEQDDVVRGCHVRTPRHASVPPSTG